MTATFARAVETRLTGRAEMVLKHDIRTWEALVYGPLPPEMEELEDDEPTFDDDDFEHEDDLNGILGFEGEE